ncbi:MAG: cyclic nucleotide-binding domain-containing protein [Cyanobacteria bacterium P01_H01_bin.15]
MPEVAIFKSLRQSYLAEDLTISELNRLVAASEEIAIAKNTVLIEENAAVNGLYVLLTGKIDIFDHDRQGHYQLIDELLPGSLIGEDSILIHGTSPVKIQASTDCRLFHLDQAAVNTILNANDALSGKLYANLYSSFAPKFNHFTEAVADLLSHQEELLHTIENLQEGPEEVRALKSQLQQQAKNLHSERKNLKRQLGQARVIAQRTEHNRWSERLLSAAAGIVLGIAFSGGLTWIRAQSAYQWQLPPSVESNEPFYPAIFPSIRTKKHCETSPARRWVDGKCYDYRHNPNW